MMLPPHRLDSRGGLVIDGKGNTMNVLMERDRRCLARAKATFIGYAAWGQGTLQSYIRHYSRIRSLPSREWHGRTLYLVHCAACGQRRGIPEYVLWHLVDPCHPICEWCARASRVPAPSSPSS